MPTRTLLVLLPVLLLAACAGPSGPDRGAGAGVRADRAAVVRSALDMIGTPYRYGGSSPRGFDCSGLVVYSYARGGAAGLPHSASALAERAAPIPIEELEPGDLIFFDLGQRKPVHVAIYVGQRRFVHAPSSGGRVEQVDFDHVYWGPRLRKAGRLVRR